VPHQDYRLEDFLGDETFRHWANRTDALHAAAWDDWLREHPDQAALAGQAADIVRGLHFDKAPTDPAKTEEDWERLRAALHAQTTAPVRPLYARLYRVAAAVALLLTVLGGAWYLAFRPVTYATDYGQKRTVVLPDGSRVTLNAHSRLVVPRRWPDGDPRRVELVGEAFFAVTEKAAPGGPVKFVVRTRDLDVEVLGTQFNVKQRSRRTTVTLESGSIQLRPRDARLAGLRMQPGEQVDFGGDRLVPHRVPDPARFSTWKQGQLVLDGKTLADVAKVIEETYGRKVIFREAALAQVKLSGTYPLDDMAMLLRALALAAQLDVTYNDKQVIFGRHEMGDMRH
jgi:ferric-dicitrate binding protein FerR (iron transport regulator)